MKINVYLYICFLLGVLITGISANDLYQGNLHGYQHRQRNHRHSMTIIKGRVMDAATKEPLHGVNVFIDHTTIGAATDKNGNYVIHKAPIGELHLVASMIGYDIGHQKITTQKDSTVTVDFDLREGLVEMSSVVVTGTATPHLFTDTPVRTKIVPRKLIKQNFSTNLAEALDLQTGVRVENNCQNCNFTQVRINGLEGKYSEILVDGVPVMSTLAGVYGLEQLPEEMIQQIEIVKGGGSALYGGGAVGGVINIITARPTQNKTGIRYLYNSINGEPDHQIGVISEIKSQDETSGAYVFASTRSREPYDHNDDGFSELGQIKNESLGFKWVYSAHKNAELKTQMHRIHEIRRGGNMFKKPYHEAQVAEAAETWRWGGSVLWNHRPSTQFDYNLYYSVAHTRRHSFYGGLGDDPDWNSDKNRLENLAAYGRTRNPLHVAGTQFNAKLGRNLFTGGIQYKSDHLKDNSVLNTNYHVDETFTNIGLFLQDNLHFLKDEALEFVAGSRLDKHSELDNIVFSPRLNAKYNLTSSLIIRGAITTGFKAPQIFDEDLHIEAIDGRQRVVRNADNLTEEKSISLTGGFDVQSSNNSMPFLFSVSGFYTKLDDAFALEVEPDDDPNMIHITRINTDGARVIGIEVNFAARLLSGFELRGGLTYKQNEYDSKYEAVEGFSTTEFMRTPDIYGNMSMSYDVNTAFTITSSLNYTGSARVPNEEPATGASYVKQSDTFVELDMGVSCHLPLFLSQSPQLSLGVKNIMNAYQDDLETGAARNPAYVYGPGQPRTFYIALEIDI